MQRVTSSRVSRRIPPLVISEPPQKSRRVSVLLLDSSFSNQDVRRCRSILYQSSSILLMQIYFMFM
jgi:hypothetical protein